MRCPLRSVCDTETGQVRAREGLECPVRDHVNDAPRVDLSGVALHEDGVDGVGQSEFGEVLRGIVFHLIRFEIGYTKDGEDS